MNLLILSCGTRDKVVQYFRKAFGAEGRVICTDCSPYAPALYEADAHYIVPRITEPKYLDIIYDICRKESITGVLSLIDPELSLIAAHKDQFAALGVTVVGSDYALCERTLNKWELYCWMKEHGYPCVKTYASLEDLDKALHQGEIAFPVFVKPMKGSASIQIAKADDWETAAFLFSHGDEMIIQEYMTGQEIGADAYIDLISKEVVSIFTKKKLVMRAGETDKAVSFFDADLNSQITQFARENGFVGQIDIDLFEQDGVYYFSEVNPRFGGGYPHAYACGVDHMALIKNNLLGIANPVRTEPYPENQVMMKYCEIMLTDAAAVKKEAAI